MCVATCQRLTNHLLVSPFSTVYLVMFRDLVAFLYFVHETNGFFMAFASMMSKQKVFGFDP